MKKLQNRKGFTLVELLIVMAIIGVLMMLAIPRFAKGTDSAKLRTMQANVRTLASVCQTYYADTEKWPSNIGDLSSYISKDTYGESSGKIDGKNGAKPEGAEYEVKGATEGKVIGKVKLSAKLDPLPENVTLDTNDETIAIFTMSYK